MSPAEANVLVIGAGGLGSPASLALLHAGVRSLSIWDHDVVDESNLPRQTWFHTGDVGQPKVDVLRRRALAAFPGASIEVQRAKVEADAAARLFAAHDVVIDGTDAPLAKFAFSDAAVESGVPLIHGGVLRWEGLAMAIVPGGPCLRCLFEDPAQALDGPTCASAGVIGAVAGWVGAQQARLALATLGSDKTGLCGETSLHRMDGRKLRWRTTRVTRRDDCGCASKSTLAPTPTFKEGARA